MGTEYFKCAGDSARYSRRVSALRNGEQHTGYRSVGRLVIVVGVAIDAGSLRTVRELDKISQDIERLVALGID